MKSNRDFQHTNTKLKRIPWLSARDPGEKYANLMHHFNKESLTMCFYELDGRKAVGIDGIDKELYGENLDTNLEGLSLVMGNYHAGLFTRRAAAMWFPYSTLIALIGLLYSTIRLARTKDLCNVEVELIGLFDFSF